MNGRREFRRLLRDQILRKIPENHVASIADDLHVVAWLWRNASWDAGLWYLQDGYRRNWGKAMRSLQLYLHGRDAERTSDEAGS